MFKNTIYVLFFLLVISKNFFTKLKNVTLYLIQNFFKKNYELNNYLKINFNYWNSKNKVKKTNEKVLITDFVSHPGYTITTSIIGKRVSEIENLETMGFVRNYDIRGSKIIKSFGVNNICYLKYGGFFRRLFFFLKSIMILQRYKNVDEFIKYKDKNISIGLIVYDHILRHSLIGTTNKITFKFYYFLSEALNINKFCKNFFSQNNIHSVIQAEKQFLPSAIIFQNALENNCRVYSKEGGVNCFGVRVCSDISKKFSSKLLHSKDLFGYIFKNYKDQALIEGKNLINRRFSGIASPNDLHEVHLAFKTGNKFSKEDLCKSLNWNLDKPIIGIFASDFVDGNFESSWRLFKDNLSWLRSTLQYIKDIKNVNWLVKAHPVGQRESTKTSTKKEFYSIVGNSENIALFDEKFSSKSLPNCLDLVLTCMGSIGLEYPCFGIPSIIAGESYYGGFGFTHEPKTQEEYLSWLKNISNIKKFELSKDQVEKAIVYFYVCFVLTKVTNPLIPNFDPSRNYDEKKFWTEFCKSIKNYNEKNDNFYKMLEIQIKKNNRHTVDYNQINTK